MLKRQLIAPYLHTLEQTIQLSVIWDAVPSIVTPLWCDVKIEPFLHKVKTQIYRKAILKHRSSSHPLETERKGQNSCHFVMTSPNGNIFRVTGHLCGWIHRSPVNSPHKGQWRWALMFSLIYAWINGWENNGDAGDLRRHRAHYDVTVMVGHVIIVKTPRRTKFSDSVSNLQRRTTASDNSCLIAVSTVPWHGWTARILIFDNQRR